LASASVASAADGLAGGVSYLPMIVRASPSDVWSLSGPITRRRCRSKRDRETQVCDGT
jgi:hypothetical protein